MARTTSRPMESSDATMYRKITARLNYLALDRPDIAYACKEASRTMARPEVQDWEKLERLAGYLKACPPLVYGYDWQRDSPLSAATDADWAGCLATRKSTSGGFVCRGNHLRKAWSKSQPVVTLSTAEAELIACEKGSTELIGMGSASEDFGKREELSLRIDATACSAIIHRTGVGKVRHLDARRLWIQEKANSGEISCRRLVGSVT